jgi:hypothetical protein
MKFNKQQNDELVKNQHKLHRVLKMLVLKNGKQVYIDDFDRRDKAVEHYLRKYNILGTSVECYWRPVGACILIGKAF